MTEIKRAKTKEIEDKLQKLLDGGNEDVSFSNTREKNQFTSFIRKEIDFSNPDAGKAFENALYLSELCAKELGLGVTSLISAFLYVLHKHQIVSLEQINSLKLDGCYPIIEGLLKISDFGINKSEQQADNFRNLLLSLAKDVRVILIKLAEQIVIMRSLETQSREEQIRISHEAFYLYAPLGHRLGLYKLKSELEDLALKYTESDTYQDIANKLNQTSLARKKFIADFISPIEKRLKTEGFKFEIKGRPKSIFSIFQKIKKTNVSFEEVYDKFAIRIILDSETENEKADCWRVYSIVTESYQPNPLRLRDWISVPKTNGYESLHTTVVIPGGQWVEIQIRTRRMDDIAERGFAAHWKYKGGKKNAVDNWLSKVRELIESPETESSDIIDDFKLSLYNKEIFIFTPKGDLRKFPKGATVLDFAFEIHSEVGSACVGGLVNGKNVPIRYAMQNGDKVEILTSKNQKPKLDWLNYVVTSKAKSKIKQTLNAEKVKGAELGKDIIKRRFKNWKFGYNDTLINVLLKHYKINTSLDFYYLVANEKIDLTEIKEVLTQAVSQKEKEDTSAPLPKQYSEKEPQTLDSDDYLIIDKRLMNIDYKLSKCCNPVFGDEIFGFVTIGDGIKIHRVNCPNASQMHSKYSYRIVNAKWKATDGLKTFSSEIYINGIDEFGMISKISDLISNQLNMSLRSINMNSNEGMFTGKLQVMVNDKKHLEGLIKRLLQMDNILKVNRIEDTL